MVAAVGSENWSQVKREYKERLNFWKQKITDTFQAQLLAMGEATNGHGIDYNSSRAMVGDMVATMRKLFADEHGTDYDDIHVSRMNGLRNDRW